MISILFLALLGGLVLNVMPCVLPVLAIKAFHMVEHSGQSVRQRRMHGIAYTLGTMSLLVALATLAVFAKLVLGRAVHWGSQFQNPYFVAGMTAVVFAFALNALGVFEITLSLSRPSKAGEEADDEGFLGSYVNGLFAAIMATPCSAPFLGSAVAFALGADTPWWETELIFAMVGFGLALPYLLLTFVPSLGNKLPRPGKWMETAKQLMGFTLMVTAVWLFRALQKQISEDSSNSFLFFLVFLAIALWAGGRFGGGAASTRKRWTVRLGQAALVGTAGFFMLSFTRAGNDACVEPAPSASSGTVEDVVADGHLRWTPYGAERVASEHARGRPVFVDFTAAWCISCQANDKAFIETDLVRGAFRSSGVLPMQVDMTNDNPTGEALMTKLGRSGIPIYVILFPDGQIDLLPQVITAEMVADRLQAAAKKFPIEKFGARTTESGRPPS